MANEYGLDSAYFKKNLEILLRDIERYTPAEMNRACQRLANVAYHQCESRKSGDKNPRDPFEATEIDDDQT